MLHCFCFRNFLLDWTRVKKMIITIKLNNKIVYFIKIPHFLFFAFALNLYVRF